MCERGRSAGQEESGDVMGVKEGVESDDWEGKV